MKRLPRDPIRFDLLNAFAEFGRSEKISLWDPSASDGFVERARASISRSLSNAALLYGVRTERMFESMVASLGAVEILKSEDSGEIYVSDETLKVPDFRLVMADGSQMLVEVKNFYQEQDPVRLFEFDRAYFDGLVRYSDAMKANLLVAIYWARWNIWTLVRPEAFTHRNDKRTLSMLEAMKANHMVSIGDYSLGTRFPLSFVMHADKSRPRRVLPDGNGAFTIANVEIYCAGKLIEDTAEQRIATYLIFYGNWVYESIPRVIHDEIEAVEHRWAPEEDHDQGFEIIGSLSGLFSGYYKFATQAEGQMGQLRLNITPGSWGSFVPANHEAKMLPLWRFKLRPSPPADAG